MPRPQPVRAYTRASGSLAPVQDCPLGRFACEREADSIGCAYLGEVRRLDEGLYLECHAQPERDLVG